MSASVRMRQKKGSRLRFVKDVVRWPRSWACLGADKFQEGFQVHPCPVACAPLHRARCRFGMFKFGRERCGSCPGESRADFPGVSLQLLDLLKWTLAAYEGFFREEYITVVEARSILYAVRYAESNYPPGRLLILSDNLALVLLLCKGRSKLFTLLSVMRRIFTSGFRAVLSYRSGGYRQS